MADPRKEKPLPLMFLCSDMFWLEDSGVLYDLGLFHFTANISGKHAAITIDYCSLVNLISVETVEKLQLTTCPKEFPYMLAHNDDALPITHVACVPVTIYGHTVRITCDVIPRALNCCHLLLGRYWCKKFKVVFDFDHLDPLIHWNNKTTWLARTPFEKFQEVRRQNLCPPVIPIDKPPKNVHVANENLSVHTNLGLHVTETCVVSTNVINSAPSVVPCAMQVTFEEREQHVVKPASPLEKDVPVPTTSEEDDIDNDLISIGLAPEGGEGGRRPQDTRRRRPRC